MPSHPTDNPYTDKALRRLQRLQREVNRHSDSTLDGIDQFVAGTLSSIPHPWAEFFVGYTKDEIKDAVAAERVFRAVTLDQWLEIARDFYQDSTGTTRRPKLLEDEFVAYLRLNAKYGDRESFRPEQFLNAVWALGKDPKIDHATFESLPYCIEDWMTTRPGDAELSLCWQTYLGHNELFKAYRLPNEDESYARISSADDDNTPITVASPNCKARCHMPKSQFAIYDFAVGISHKNDGECWLSRATCAKWARMHPQTVRTAIDWLVEHGWLTVVKAPRKGVGGQGQYRVVGHAEWIALRGSASCVQVAAD